MKMLLIRAVIAPGMVGHKASVLVPAKKSLTADLAIPTFAKRKGEHSQPDISLPRLAGTGELSLAVESRGIIDQNGLAQGRVRNPRRQQVKEMAVVKPKRWRYIARLATIASVGMRPIRTPQNPVRIGCDQRARQRHHVGIIGRAV